MACAAGVGARAASIFGVLRSEHVADRTTEVAELLYQKHAWLLPTLARKRYFGLRDTNNAVAELLARLISNGKIEELILKTSDVELESRFWSWLNCCYQNQSYSDADKVNGIRRKSKVNLSSDIGGDEWQIVEEMAAWNGDNTNHKRTADQLATLKAVGRNFKGKEKEIFELLSDGKTQTEIAALLGYAHPSGMHRYVRSIRATLQKSMESQRSG